jgi:hypothetical protein
VIHTDTSIQERKNRVRSRDIIQPLHILSKDWRSLKHLFENYRSVIDKILAATNRPGPTVPDPRDPIMFRADTNVI